MENTNNKDLLASLNESIVSSMSKNNFDSSDENTSVGLFTLKTANNWIDEAKNRPMPKMLFGSLWFEGELSILFADTNLGKSILAVQIANSISKNQEITGFKLESEKQSVLYFDFELSDKQFENRYSENYDNHYSFDSNFIRIEINPDVEIPANTDFESFLHYSLEKAILSTNSKVLIIDNITFLKNETEKAKDALPLMKHLKSLKSKYGLSILALAHTPKRDLSKPITRNDLAGSKMLINFCDSSFTIGESTNDKNLRYIKQIKQRNTEQIYDSENICICEVVKNENFLEFQFVGYGSETEHLKQVSSGDKEELIETVKELNKQGKSQRDISRELNISVGAVNKYLRL